MGSFKDGLIDAMHMACELERGSKNRPVERAMRRFQAHALAHMIKTVSAIENTVQKAKEKTK